MGSKLGGGNSNIFGGIFTPKRWGFMIQSDVETMRLAEFLLVGGGALMVRRNSADVFHQLRYISWHILGDRLIP